MNSARVQSRMGVVSSYFRMLLIGLKMEVDSALRKFGVCKMPENGPKTLDHFINNLLTLSIEVQFSTGISWCLHINYHRIENLQCL